MDEKRYLGGTYSDIIIGRPYESCTESFLETGCFETYDEAKKHAKYMMTKFFRALLYVNKISHDSITTWRAIPVQDYSEPWWELDIDEINEHLMEKYNVSQRVKSFINENIQPKDSSNIINFYDESTVI